MGFLDKISPKTRILLSIVLITGSLVLALYLREPLIAAIGYALGIFFVNFFRDNITRTAYAATIGIFTYIGVGLMLSNYSQKDINRVIYLTLCIGGIMGIIFASDRIVNERTFVLGLLMCSIAALYIYRDKFGLDKYF